MDTKEINDKYRKYLYGLTTYYKEPLPFVKGEGKWLTDAAGRRYLDFFGGIVTVSLGHCHPRVVAAIEKQVRTLQHVSTLFPTIPIVELAETLEAIFPGERPAKMFFTNSGTEAIETAILTARIHTQRTEVIALRPRLPRPEHALDVADRTCELAPRRRAGPVHPATPWLRIAIAARWA
jgi:4-aminobutyrate aminotransferase-like enzyme